MWDGNGNGNGNGNWNGKWEIEWDGNGNGNGKVVISEMGRKGGRVLQVEWGKGLGFPLKS